jgi:hypothetical protein
MDLLIAQPSHSEEFKSADVTATLENTITMDDFEDVDINEVIILSLLALILFCETVGISSKRFMIYVSRQYQKLNLKLSLKNQIQ